MVLSFQIFLYMFSLKGIYYFFVVNFWRWFLNFFWKTFGFDDVKSLELYEQKLLKSLPPTLTRAEKVSIGHGLLEVWTISIRPQKSSETPIVLLHSLGYGASFWLLNLQELSKSRTVFAIDMLGFGKSSRTSFSTGLTDIETELVEFLEAWRAKINLEKFILLGHGFGGYVAYLYAAQFSKRVRHIVFVEPWGFDVDHKHYKKFVSIKPQKYPLPSATKIMAFFLSHMNQFSLLRFLGPGWGLDLIKRMRGDLLEKFSSISNSETLAQYLYHWNTSLAPTGETAFYRLSQFSGFAKHPVLFRINSICKSIPMTFIIGSRSSYVSHDIGYQVKQLRSGSYVDIQVINGAGHYAFVEKSELFNRLVNLICLRVDSGFDSLKEMSRDLRMRSKRCDSSPSILESQISLSPPPTLDVRNTFAKRRNHRTSLCLPGDIIEEGDSDDDDSEVDMTELKKENVPTFLCGDENSDDDDGDYY